MAKTRVIRTAPDVPARSPRLGEDQIALELARLPEWSQTSDAIQRTFAFKNFVEAMNFVSRVAPLAESANHHPDILIRYNKVTLTLSTHDSSGITAKDFDLAAKIDALLPAAEI